MLPEGCEAFTCPICPCPSLVEILERKINKYEKKESTHCVAVHWQICDAVEEIRKRKIDNEYFCVL